MASSFVLASLRGSTFSEALEGIFPFAKTHEDGERLAQSVVCTSSPLRSLRPCWESILNIPWSKQGICR